MIVCEDWLYFFFGFMLMYMVYFVLRWNLGIVLIVVVVFEGEMVMVDWWVIICCGDVFE